MKYIYLLLFSVLCLIINFHLLIPFVGESLYGITLILMPIFTVIIIILFFMHVYNAIFLFYQKYKNNIFYFLFFIFYFLFFIFYFLFFIFYFLGFNNIPLEMILLCVTIPLLIMYSIMLVEFYKRYIAIFLSIGSDILLKYTLSNDLVAVFTTSNKQFYELKLYILPLTFVIIQLAIEAYYFYQKEKPKWQRYERIQRYKESKKQ
jgi:hypothetical protein